jgi:hypothetical protein
LNHAGRVLLRYPDRLVYPDMSTAVLADPGRSRHLLCESCGLCASNVEQKDNLGELVLQPRLEGWGGIQKRFNSFG